MKLKIFVVILFLFQLGNFGCGQGGNDSSEQTIDNEAIEISSEKEILVGASRLSKYHDKLEGKKIAMVVNQTSKIGNSHLVDTLLQLNIQIEKIFAPEHGFRGTADAGEKIQDGKDSKTGIPIVSLYGKSKKPSAESLDGLDLVVFDIQDVGARFYTYISTMHYVMQACAENQVDFMVLDRPNPNGHFVDGPLLQKSHQSFVGMHEIPVVHGMTIGEYAQMINGEGWLRENLQVELTVIQCENYDHNSYYELPIKPSPNLPNMRAILLYPSLCFFEGTIVSVGRGTIYPFQIFGAPDFEYGEYQFTPKPGPGSKYPKHEGKECNGFHLSHLQEAMIWKKAKLDLSFLLNFYKDYPHKDAFFNENLFFDKLAGGKALREAIIDGKSEKEIRKTWEADLNQFKITRRKYLLYEDFE